MFKVEGKLVIDNSIGDTTPVVSVLMPVYNAQLYVEKAIKSILTQTFIDFEFIILDDGSTDNSLNILEQYAKQDIRIRIISRENKGLIVSLNELVEQARGQYVARMDADDISRPERFAMQVDFLSKNTDHIVVGSSIEKINEKGQIIASFKSLTAHKDIDRMQLAGHTSICHPAAMLCRKAVIQVKGYDQQMEAGEDLDLWLRLAEIGKLANLPQVLLQYRLHNESISEASRDIQQQTMRRACEQAWVRRGIQGEFDQKSVDWRPGTDVSSQHKYAVKYGWMSWNQGYTATWWTYTRRAIFLKPFDISSWKLLVFGLVKSPKKL